MAILSGNFIDYSLIWLTSFIFVQNYNQAFFKRGILSAQIIIEVRNILS